jgi:hypothetical protein
MAPCVEHLRRSVEVAVARPSFTASAARDYGAILQAAVALGRREGLAGIAAAVAALPALPWDYQYPEQGLAERIGFAEVIGPDGPLDAPLCRVGFTLMAADTFYPLHAHPAVELYWVVAGRAEWSQSQTRRMVPPGEFVLHGCNEPHAMRTFAEPLLALYCWSGDVQTAPRYV